MINLKRGSLVCGLAILFSTRLLGSVTITEPTGGQNISADQALNSTNGPAFTALGSIVITEGATADFAAGNNLTLILTPPSGWRFAAGAGSVTFQGSRDMTAASISVTASSATVTYSASGTSKLDVLTISGMQVQPLDGANAPLAGYIVRSSANPGTASVAGVLNDFTPFALLNTVGGAPRALAMQTQPSTNAIVGVKFPIQPEVKTLDQFGNAIAFDTTTVITAARAAGSGALQGALTQTAVAGVAYFTNLYHSVTGTITIQFTATNLTSVTSDPIVVGLAPGDRLVFTTQPGSATAGAPFGVQPVLRTRDLFGSNSTVGLPASQFVTLAVTSGTGTLLGTTTLDIGTSAGNGVITFSDLQINVAGSGKRLTASGPGMVDGVSSNFTVNAAAFTKLQLLVPGETAAPDTASGKTGTPNPQSSTVPFNVTVNAADAYWNLVTNVTHTVGITSSDPQATLPANAALVAGTKNFSVTLKSLGDWTVTATDVSDGSKLPSTSPPINVGSGPAGKLKIQTQPSPTATAGEVFAQQPIIRVEDAAGNLVTTDNGRVITATRGTGTGTLQGTLTTTTVNGVATFADLSYNVAETITLNFTASGLTNTVSSNVVVSAAAADRLVFTTQPGGISRVGSNLATQPVIKTRDQFGNNSSVGLPANLTLTLALTQGSGSLLGTTSFNIGTTAGNGTVTFTNLQCSDAGTNKQITAAATGLTGAASATFTVGGVDRSLDGLAISADTAGGTYTALTGPTYYEAASADAGAGTIILNAPAGFVFDTGGTAPTVLITRLTGSGGNANNINAVASGTAAAITSRTTTQISFTVSSVSGGGVTCSLTWQGIRVRPSAGTPLASGNITKTGTSTMQAVTASSTSFGTLNETVGLATRLAFTTQPGAAIAGAPFGTQPVVVTRDQFGNNSTNGLAANKIVSLALTSGTGPLLGTTNLDIGSAAGKGVVNFSGLQLNIAATNDQLTATATGFTNAVSSTFTNSAAAANKLTIQTQPSAAATAGAAFAQQPVIRVEDAFGNLRTTDNSTVVTVSRATGSGTLLGTTSRTAVNGVVTFTNLSYNKAETITLSFASSGLAGAASSSVAVSPAAANRLTIQTQPSASATAGVAFAQQPVIRIEDQFGNLRSGDSSTVVTAARASGSGTLQGTTAVTAVNGVVNFANLAHNVATNITIQFTSGGLSNATSSAIAVSPAAANKLTIQTQPSATATAGVTFSQQPTVRVEDAFGNLLSGDNSTVVTASRSAGSGTLQGTLTATAVNGVASFANLSHNVATNITIQFSGTSVSPVTSTSIAVSAAAADHLAIQTQPSSSATAGSAFAPQPVIRIEDQFGNLRTSDNTTIVTASRATGTAALQGSTSRTAAGGVVTFTNLSYNVAETITIGFAGGSLTGATSGNVVVSPAAANRLAIQTQPSANATAGVVFAQQPVIRIEDQFGNLRATDNSTVVTAARAAGNGTLQGTTTATAANGVVAFANLVHIVATNITIQFTSSGLTNATSTTIAVSPAAANRLTLQTQPSPTATAGALFAQQPVLRIEDAFGNLISSDSASVVTATRNAGSGTLQGTVARPALNGVVAFTNLSYTVAETITIDFASGSLAGVTSSSVVVNPAAPNHLAIQTQPSSAATAGIVFAQQPVIRVEDQFGNACANTNVAVTATRNAGSGALQGATVITTAGGVATFTNLSHNVAGTITINFSGAGVPFVTSDAVAVSVGAASRLTIQTQPSSSATAGVTFAQQPVIRIEDSVGNLIADDNSTVITATRLAGNGALQGTVTTTAVNGVATFTNLSHNVATNITIQFSGGSLTSATSVSVAVSPAAADHLAIQTQPSSSATAGVTFAQQPVIRIEDAFGNLRSGDNVSVVTASRAAGSGVLQGTTTRTVTGGVVTFTNLSYNVAETITLGFASGGLTEATSGNVSVSAAAANRLTILTQPSATATAGVAFAQQPVIRIEDAFGNPRTTDNSTVVTAARLAGNGTLQGSTDVTASGGVVTFANLSHLVANNITIQFTSGGLSNATSSVVAVSPGTFTKLQLLVPGETAAAGTATGKTGTPLSQTVGTIFNVTVNAVDANWNLVSAVSDLVGLTSSDPAASLPANAPLAAGTRVFAATLNTAGSATLTASDLADAGKTANTSPAISVASAQFTGATGGSAISADATGGAYTNLAGPSYTELANGNVGTGTIILKSPSGFVFDTGGTAPTVRITGGSTSAKNVNGVSSGTSVAMTSVTTTQLTFTVTSVSSGGQLCTLTWQNVRVRPSAGTPLASGNLSLAGTATLVGVSTNSSLGALREVVGGARRLAMVTQPSATATAGALFAQQPVIQVQDQFGNFRANDNSTVVSASRNSGGGVLQGTTNRTAVAGLVAFTNLCHNVATNITILFAGTGLTNATSSTVTVSAAAATGLAFATQPGNATAGSVFAQQPVIKCVDAFGNVSVTGLPLNLPLTLTLTQGAGPLQGTTSLDIGSAAGNGTANFTNLRNDAAGAGKQLTASASGYGSVTSSAFTVSPGAANKLTIQAQPSSTATAGAAFAQQPVIRVEDAFGNLRTSDNSTVVSVARNLGTGALQGTTAATASGGVASFANLNYTIAETMNMNFTSGALTGATSSDVAVSPAAANRLTILTQPSPTATAGAAFTQQPVIRIEDQYGNLRSADNSTVVTAARSVGTGTLQGTTTATASGGLASFGNLNYPIAETLKIGFSSGSLSNATSANVVVSAGAFTKLQLLAPGETAAPGSVNGKTGAPNIQFPGTAFNVTVNAVDDNWNPVSSVADVIAISSSDTNAILPSSGALVGGTKQFSVALQTAGTLTAADATDNSKLAATSATIPVNARLAPATGGGSISADTVGGAFTTLTGPSYAEFATAEVGTGTIQLLAPSGFVFDTAAPAPTVLITRLSGSGGNTNNINDVASGTAAAMTSVTTTQMTFTVTGASALGVTCQLTWQNVRVRPTAGAPLVVTNLVRAGTAALSGITNLVSNFGPLREVAGAANRLAVQTQPSATATAGVAFAQQPVLCVKDQFGNVRNAANGNADNATLVVATRTAGSGVLQGVTNLVAANGVIAFTNLTHLVATNITISFTSSGLIGTNSTAIAVGAAAATKLGFSTQPGNGTVGGLLAPQPVIHSCDAFGNDSSATLGSSRTVTVSLSSGSGTLLGTTTLDIGTGAGNGVVSFTNLGVDSAGTNLQLTASASGLSDAISSAFSVAKGSQSITFGALANRTYGDAAIGLSATASSGLPVSYSIVSGPASVSGNTLTITGAGAVTVRASQTGDANWNAATPVDRSFTVAKAALTISADNKSRAYGANNPTLTASYNGFVNGEDASVLSGSANMTTTAAPSSPVSGSPYPITITQGTLVSANYSFSFVNGGLTVTKATLAVTAEDKTRTYGAANPPLTFVYSGFVNGESAMVISGSPNLNTAATASSGVAGSPYPITITAGSLSASNYAFAFVDGSLTISKATLTVAAENKSRVYGAPDPAFTATITGFVNGENAGVLSGSPSLTTTATGTSSVAGSPYAITAAQGTLSADNYGFAFTPGALTITPASLTAALTTSANPSPTGSNVTFTFTLSAQSPSTGIASGTVQFIADGAALGSPASLGGGVASLSTASLTHGLHSIAATYAGDGNFYGVTNSLGATQIINSAPVAALATYMRSSNFWVKISIPQLLTNYTSDADADARTLVAVGSGTNGATIIVFGDGIYYLPSDSDPNRNRPDYFDYVVSDGFPGGSVTNKICVRTDSPVTPPAAATVTALSLQSNGALLSFTGTAGASYRVERCVALEGNNTVWTDLGAVTTDEQGVAQFTDAYAPAEQAFYRVVSQ